MMVEEKERKKKEEEEKEEGGEDDVTENGVLSKIDFSSWKKTFGKDAEVAMLTSTPQHPKKMHSKMTARVRMEG
ncbi:hypothetical protein FACS189472_14780 [Alphaproteobacteria bacterium]|nr:hypothetical protein FACS189472_14780 [Alphaproteobacteria bacterium]